MIIPVDETNLFLAAIIHSLSWQDSHLSFCSPDFVKLHTPEHQQKYMEEKLNNGSRFFMLVKHKPVGIVSVTGSLIEDLYIRPDEQNKGYGTELLQFAAKTCPESPQDFWFLLYSQYYSEQECPVPVTGVPFSLSPAVLFD